MSDMRIVPCWVILTRTRRARLWNPEAVAFWAKDAHRLAKDRRELAREQGEQIEIRVVSDRIEMDLAGPGGKIF